VKDYLVLAALVVTFATFVTAHLFLTWRLLWYSRPRWRGLVVVALPPLAPIWGYQMGYRRLASTWLASVIGYLLARLIVV
jgi:hypothetical protein